MLKALALLVAWILIFSAIFTPPVMSLLLYLKPDLSWPFSRVFDRVAMVAAATGIFILRKSFDISGLLAFFKAARGRRVFDLLLGLFLTALSLSAAIYFLLHSGRLVSYDPQNSSLEFKFLKIILSMLLVSVIEEAFFRGLIFSSLKKKMSLYLAAVTSAVLYAFAHFITPVKSFSYAEFDALAGFIYLGEIFGRISSPEIYPAFFGLFLVGMILCYVIHRTGSIYLCIGLHCGWASGLKLIKLFTQLPAGTSIPSDLGARYFLVAQEAAWVSMLAVFLALVLYVEKIRKA